MSVYFFDTSALAKRYLTSETGSNWVQGLTAPTAGHSIVVSQLTTVEMISILTRQMHEGKLTAVNVATLEQAFLAHLQQDYYVIAVDKSIFTGARAVVKTHNLTTLDALQLMCALDARVALRQSVEFIGTDNRLRNAARAEGFIVDSPNNHP